MNLHLKKIALWATFISFALIMPQASNTLSDADCTSLKVLRTTSSVDALISGGLLFIDAHRAAHALALARAGVLTSLCHTTINNKKVKPQTLRIRDWLTIGGCLTKNILRASAPFIKNSSARMAAYSATMLLELGAMGHAGYYLLDDKKDMQNYYLACLASLGLQAFIQGKALQIPATQPGSSLLTPTEENAQEETPRPSAENQSTDQNQPLPTGAQLPIQGQQLPKPPVREKSLLEETDLAILGTCSEGDFKQALYKDIKKASALTHPIDFSTFNDHSNCTICGDKDNYDDWIFNLNDSGNGMASFCHVGCLAKHFANKVTPQEAEVPEEQISAQERADLRRFIQENLRAVHQRTPTEAELQNAIRDMCATTKIPGALPTDPFTKKRFCETWESYFIYPKA